MPAFAYRAVDPRGAAKQGVIEASSAAAARQLLRDREWLPTSVETATGGAAPGIGARLFRRRIGARALSTVTRQIATLVTSEVNIEHALKLVADQAEGAALRSLLLDVRGSILDGYSFAAALRLHPATFPEFYTASVAAGEQAGKLSQVLEHLADFVESRQRNQQKVQLALLYPALLAVVSFGMMALLMVYVVPDIVRVFISRGAELPFLTRALIAISGGLQAYGLAMAIALLAAILVFGRWLRVPANRLRFDRGIATTWPLARFSRQYNAARFAASLATLVQSSVPLVEALNAAAAVTPNRHVRAAAVGVAARVREGATLQTAMTESGIFPSMLVAIVASGENGGQLGPALGRAAAELERELEAMASLLVSLVEPLVLLMMGGLVLLMVLAILLPIINLNNIVGM
ncbi:MULTISPECIES: type II secretion system F family protein [unclassified Sphingomonas]|uniref:type II secretion system F family protein n=1 Tax=unclassified Sphingomonas TaxID=196159 RepID=UPI0006F4BF0C|nr:MULTISPECIES: type II secretion system F family protein [unclassified Sphingomonas]KQX21661.1 type II secretion system protein GspF [Sphingomonas sp. Root1294]KQY72977.1 type II secretion system protein GspF [Sphingomonas sp. Root50]KRB88228.1 type II secretion system protein GspF [Sphingomonas sp. Root720]